MADRERKSPPRFDDESVTKALGLDEPMEVPAALKDSSKCEICKKMLTQSEIAAAITDHLPGICGEARPM